jgi:hypothetical protein
VAYGLRQVAVVAAIAFLAPPLADAQGRFDWIGAS